MTEDLFIDYLLGVTPQINTYLRRCLAKGPQDAGLESYLYGILNEFIARGGKRTRPAMTMLACEAMGGNPRKALATGCAIEFFHAAALIHDDIMDASVLRRGKECAHILYGQPLAINAGDYALGLTCTVVLRDELLDSATKLAVLEVIGEMSERTVEGQALDVGWVRDAVYDLTLDDYIRMALGKTGYYSGIAPLKAGAIIGGGTDEEIRALEGFGKNVSIAFQIQDDLLNILGNQAVIGKDHLSDIFESKRTLMVIHCLTAAAAEDRARLIDLLELGHDKSWEEATEVVDLLKRYGSIEFAQETARALIVGGRSYLSAVRESKARDILDSMAGYFLERTK